MERAPHAPLLTSPPSGHGAEQLRLEDELALLVLLARLVRLVVFPADRLLALPAVDVTHDVAARRHVAFAGIGLGDVDDAVEEVCFSMLAAEVLDELALGVASEGRMGGNGRD